MKKVVILFISLIFFAGCKENREPDYLLSEDQMVSVLIDIHITEGIASALPIKYDSSQVIYKLMEKEVFLKHEVSDSVFTKSMLYYLQDPTTMDKLYGRVVDSLSLKQTLRNAQVNNQ